MWCKHCRQDVPALPSDDKHSLCCPRCGEAIRVDASTPADQATTYDGWELDEQLRHTERVLQTAEVNGREAETIGARRRDSICRTPARRPGTSRGSVRHRTNRGRPRTPVTALSPAR
jgi:hypothetical protein